MSLNYYDLNSVTIETRFAPWTHGHSIDAITGLRAELDATQSGLTSTSDIQFHNATIFGNLTPNASGSQNLGASDKHFGIAWIDELHLATSTLYLGDTPVMGTNQDTVEIKADLDQSITLKTTGTGTSKIISQDGVQISSSGMNSDVVIQATGAGGSVAFGAVSSIDFTAPDANFTGDIAVTGNAVFSTATFTDNVVFQGDNITMNTSTFTAQDNRITLNDGEQGSGVTAIYAGFDIDRGLLASWQFVFDEANDRFIYGEVGGTVNEVVSKAYVDSLVAPKLDASAYTAADVFAKVLTLDGSGSGLDADTLDGYDSTYFIKSAQDYMDAIQSIDGAGSLLDADKLDGHEATYFAPQATTYTKTEVDGLVIVKLDASAYTAADVLAKLINVDGSSSGLDADMLDGHHSSYFSPSTHTHSSLYLGITAKAADSDKLDGHDSTYFAVASTTDSSAEVDAKIAALVDSSPAALDTLNELAAALGDDPNFATTVNNNIAAKLDASAYTAADVLAKIKTVDGPGSGLNADLLDGHSSSYFATSTHNHDAAYLGITAKAADSDKLDGYNLSSTSTVNTVTLRNSSGDISARLFRSEYDTTNATIGYIMTQVDTASNNFIRPSTPAQLIAGLPAADLLTRIKTVDGGGSGLNADMLDGQHASYFSPSTHTHSALYLGLHAKADDSNLLDGHDSTAFLRSDIDSTLSGKLTINKDVGTTPTYSSGQLELRNSNAGDVSMGFHRIGYTACQLRHESNGLILSGTTEGTAATFKSMGDIDAVGNASAASFIEGGTALSSKYLGISAKAADANLLDGHDSSYFLTTTGKAADSDKLDGINSSSFLRSDVTDYLTNTIYERGDFVVETGYRNRGIFGTYDSTKTQHIWSMGTAYRNAADGSSFGNLYGLAYKYNGSAGSHGTYQVINGTATCGMGANVWTSGELLGTATAAKYADLAEKYTVEGGVTEPGQVILIGSKVADCKISDAMASQQVLGVVSTDPGMKMNSELEDGHYVALKGRVPCKVFGAVTKGDPLVSYKDGMAISINNPMVAKLGNLANTPGIILGKALESSTETGTIEVVVL